MRIGIDIDGVITNMYEANLSNATKFFYENNINYNINPSEYDEKDMFNVSKHDMDKFWNTYLGEYSLNCPTREFAKEVISKLKEKNEVYIITSRNDEGLPHNLYGKMEEIVKIWLQKNDIKYDKLIFSSDKLKVCIENEVDIMIEDCPENILQISNKLKVLCFDAPYNKHIKGENIIRVYSWYDILKQIK